MPEYNRRLHVCEAHAKAASVTDARGNALRFCQQCSKLQPVAALKSLQRSCMAAQAKRRQRRPALGLKTNIQLPPQPPAPMAPAPAPAAPPLGGVVVLAPPPGVPLPPLLLPVPPPQPQPLLTRALEDLVAQDGFDLSMLLAVEPGSLLDLLQEFDEVLMQNMDVLGQEAPAAAPLPQHAAQHASSTVSSADRFSTFNRS
ncbi:squamosa promoter-binding 8 [Chlorella sorokiniana]|uniref:Squamosa promoter-binding 8 n=1 Tax=Chlorella sorokiniana TaxID=3076 RepID=A0A2P6TE89_CHLSO|nr:squamosa promoter-binding 8 [Chlorella sorokiniana]|eukprot:PRW20956.1 squamosa promoter-binding 8 [Chlorella sorokiniana]